MSTFKQELEDLAAEYSEEILEKIIREIQEQAIQAASQGQWSLDYSLTDHISPKILVKALKELGFEESDIKYDHFSVSISWGE